MNRKKRKQFIDLLKKLHTSKSTRLIGKVYRIIEQEINLQCHLAVMSKSH
jgi:hypothetical protein